MIIRYGQNKTWTEKLSIIYSKDSFTNQLSNPIHKSPCGRKIPSSDYRTTTMSELAHSEAEHPIISSVHRPTVTFPKYLGCKNVSDTVCRFSGLDVPMPGCRSPWCGLPAYPNKYLSIEILQSTLPKSILHYSFSVVVGYRKSWLQVVYLTSATSIRPPCQSRCAMIEA